MTLPPDDDLGKQLGDGVDPMKWLESLAARQGANPDEFITSADMEVPEADSDSVVDEPGYIDYDPFGSSAPAPGDSQPVQATSAETPAQPAVSSLGPPDEIDPLAWLESLARRQGADPDEFVTEANLEVPEVDPSTKVDEPGYTPYEAAGAAAYKRPARPAQPAQAAPPPAREPEPEPAAIGEEGDLTLEEAAAILDVGPEEMAPVAGMAAEAPVPAASTGDPLGGDVDPLAWLESLARRQGAKSEELITSADLEVPEAAADAVVDEPGYRDYQPFEAEADEEEAPAAAAPAPQPVEEAAPVPSGEDTLAWLEDLAAEQGALPISEAADPLAGLDDAEIEAMAAEGRLTAEQMEAWLSRQAESLAEVRASAESLVGDEEMAVAEPGEIPSWLQEAAPEETPAAAAEPVEEAEPAEMPDWLMEDVGEPQPDLQALLSEEPPAEAGAYEDSWAAALDEEYVTRRLGDDQGEPEWYTAALNDPDRLAALQDAQEAAPEVEAAEPEPEPEPAEAEQGELPDWLKDAAPPETLEAISDEVPDWLSEEVPEAEAEPALEDWLVEPAAEEPEAAPAAAEIDAVDEEVPELAEAEAEALDWLNEPAAEPAELPDWLIEAAPEQPAAAAPAPEPEPAQPAAPVAKPAAPAAPAPRTAARRALRPTPPPVPEGEAYAGVRTRLASNPQDHDARLELARQLKTEARLEDSLNHYEALVFDEAMLDNVEQDLAAVVEERKDVPQAMRVLGDVRLRQGRLQDALEMYRAALEQL
jgi:hypothetical protein